MGGVAWFINMPFGPYPGENFCVN